MMMGTEYGKDVYEYMLGRTLNDEMSLMSNLINCMKRPENKFSIGKRAIAQFIVVMEASYRVN